MHLPQVCHQFVYGALSAEVDCTNWTCANGYIKCSVDGWCLPANKVCDGKEDCAGGTDELGEGHKFDTKIKSCETYCADGQAQENFQQFLCLQVEMLFWLFTINTIFSQCTQLQIVKPTPAKKTNGNADIHTFALRIRMCAMVQKTCLVTSSATQNT